jgi:adenylosuccinate synthase
VVNYSITIGGINEVAMMHLDTLSGLKELKICRAYKIGNTETTFFPSDAVRLSQATCVYETLGGWEDDLSVVENFGDLPKNAQRYVEAVEKFVGRPLTMIGVGPKRTQTIERK